MAAKTGLVRVKFLQAMASESGAYLPHCFYWVPREHAKAWAAAGIVAPAPQEQAVKGPPENAATRTGKG